MTKTKNRNENGKINLYLSNNMNNICKVDECETMKDIHSIGKKLIRSGNAVCANNLPAREYAYLDKNGEMTFILLKNS